jgi:hypothetical protein
MNGREGMASRPERPPVTWDVVLFRCTTDAEFRQSLIDNPSRVLRELGLLSADETAIAQEWKANERILILPPLADTSPNRIQELRRTFTRTEPEATRLDTPARAPYSQEQPSAPMSGPAVVALGTPAGLSPLA